MYNDHYGFTGPPFHITPDLHFLFMSQKHKEALSCMEFSIIGDMGVTLITGEIGTGKTTLVRHFLKGLDKDAKVACIYNTNINPDQFLALVIQEFGFVSQGDTKPKNLKTIEKELLSLRKKGIRSLLIIDDAQNLGFDTLDEVRWLSNLQDDDSMLIQILLVGQSELMDKMRNPAMRSLAQRIGVNYHLRPFTRGEAGKYISHRLKTVKGNPDLFTKGAVDLIYQRSHGIPRMINLLCDNALVYGFTDNASKINVPIVEEVLVDNFQTWLWSPTADNPDKSVYESLPKKDTSSAVPKELQLPEHMQKVEILLEALENLADNYTRDLRQMLKFLLMRERERSRLIQTSHDELQKKYNQLLKQSQTKKKGSKTATPKK